jgi:hypothetical protein
MRPRKDLGAPFGTPGKRIALNINRDFPRPQQVNAAVQAFLQNVHGGSRAGLINRD